MKTLKRKLWHAPRNLLVAIVKLYQCTLSPDHGPLKNLHTYGFCRHHPTCSEYAKHTLLQRGVIVGLLLITARVLTCNPWKKPHPKRLGEAAKKALDR